jgi:beta-glucosidase
VARLWTLSKQLLTMADFDQANPIPVGGGADVNHIDIKDTAAIAIQVQPVLGSPTLTPALTPDEDDLNAMTGQKVFSLAKPDDRARELAAKLSFEEQVCAHLFVYMQSLDPNDQHEA